MNKQGFTVTELIVAVAIICSVVLAFGSAINEYNKQPNIKSKTLIKEVNEDQKHRPGFVYFISVQTGKVLLKSDYNENEITVKGNIVPILTWVDKLGNVHSHLVCDCESVHITNKKLILKMDQVLIDTTKEY